MLSRHNALYCKQACPLILPDLSQFSVGFFLIHGIDSQLIYSSCMTIYWCHMKVYKCDFLIIQEVFPYPIGMIVTF